MVGAGSVTEIVISHYKRKKISSWAVRMQNLVKEDEIENAQTEKEDICRENGCINYDKAVTGDINICTHSFCLLIFYGAFSVRLAGTFLVAIFVLPFTAEEFITYFRNTVELAVVFALSKYLYSGSFFGDQKEDKKSDAYGDEEKKDIKKE